MAWINLDSERRYDPETGDVQYNRNGNWQDIGNVNKRNPMSNWNYAMPTEEQVQQIKIMQQVGGNQGAAGTAAAPSSPQAAMQRSYYGQNPTISSGTGGGFTGAGTTNTAGGSTMTWNQVAQQMGLSQGDITAIQNEGVTPDQLYAGRQQGLGIADVIARSKAASAAAAPAPAPAPDPTQPETRGLQQLAQIDPASEALRTALSQSYLTPLQQAGQTGPPPAADVQSYLDLYKQIDPQGYGQRVALAGGMDQFVQHAQQQAALGTSLDPQTIRELEQSTRAGQVARGNVYGTPQLVAEAMTRGQAGMQIAQQRQAALSSALGQQQGYLGSGQGIGDVANTLYQQGFQRNLAARQAAQGGALSYLGSGQTPYQAGAGYMNAAEQRAAMAAQGGPQYNPSSLGQQYQAQQLPQYGLDMSQLAGNWYNNINQANLQGYGLGQAYGQGGSNKAMSAGAGALSGAASGALAGSAAGPYGTLIGAGVGAVAGGLGGYSR